MMGAGLSRVMWRRTALGCARCASVPPRSGQGSVSSLDQGRGRWSRSSGASRPALRVRPWTDRAHTNRPDQAAAEAFLTSKGADVVLSDFASDIPDLVDRHQPDVVLL